MIQVWSQMIKLVTDQKFHWVGYAGVARAKTKCDALQHSQALILTEGFTLVVQKVRGVLQQIQMDSINFTHLTGFCDQIS